MNRSPQVEHASYMRRLHDPACVGANFCSQSAATALANGGAILQTSAAVSLQAGEVAVRIYGSALGAFPGAESVGVVEEAGGAAQHLVGQAVLVPRLLPCGECPACRRGAVRACPQRRNRPVRPCLREVVPARALLPLVPPFVDASPATENLWPYAVLSDALLTPYSGFVRAGVCAGTVCVVLGQGLRADLTALVADSLGLVVERLSPSDEERLDPAAARREISVRAAAQGLALAGAVIVETVGSLAARARAVQMAEPAGTVLLYEPSQPLDGSAGQLVAEPQAGAALSSLAALAHIVDMQAQLIAVAPHPDLLPELLSLCARTQIDFTKLTREVSPSDMDNVMAARRCGQDGDSRLPVVRFP